MCSNKRNAQEVFQAMSSINLNASLTYPLTPYELKLAEAQRISPIGDSSPSLRS